MKLADALVSTSLAIENCKHSGNVEWATNHKHYLDKLLGMLPSGSGFDLGTKLVSAKLDKLIFETHFHHMDSVGGYDGWTKHIVTVRAAFVLKLDIHISGIDHNHIKEYIGEVFDQALSEDVPPLVA